MSLGNLIPAELQSKMQAIQNYNPTSNDDKKFFLPFIQLFQDFVSTIESKFEDFKKTMLAEVVEQKNSEISMLKADIVPRKLNISPSLKPNWMSRTSTYVRRESLIFSGDCVPACTQSEDCVKIISKLVANKIAVPNLPSLLPMCLLPIPSRTQACWYLLSTAEVLL